MSDVHLPHLEHDDEAARAPALDAPAVGALRSTGHATHRSKGLLMIGLEVLLISAGVFLGLMGEQWRERAEHRELAQDSLRRFERSSWRTAPP